MVKIITTADFSGVVEALNDLRNDSGIPKNLKLKIADMLESELCVDDGETTEDGIFTVQSVRCLGCCSLAPAIMIDREVYGGVTPAALHKILKSHRDKSA